MIDHPGPRVTFHEPDGDVRGVVVVLHGGRVRSHRPVKANQLAVLRMRPFIRELHSAGRTQGLVVAAVRFGVRGWNGDEAAPVGDAVRVLDEVRTRFGNVPVVVVGHSMGGRAALFAGGDKSVVGVLGLAPWIEPGDPFVQLAGRRLLVIHGSRDKWTDIRASRALIREVQGIAKTAAFVEVKRDGHAMLSRASEWHALTREFTFDVLGLTSIPTRAANVLQTAASGVTNLVI